MRAREPKLMSLEPKIMAIFVSESKNIFNHTLGLLKTIRARRIRQTAVKKPQMRAFLVKTVPLIWLRWMDR